MSYGISYQLSIIRYHLSGISYRVSIINHQVRIESRKLEWTTSARTSTIRPGGHQAGGGDKKVSFFSNLFGELVDFFLLGMIFGVLGMIFGELCFRWWGAGDIYLIAPRLSRGGSSGTQSRKWDPLRRCFFHMDPLS